MRGMSTEKKGIEKKGSKRWGGGDQGEIHRSGQQSYAQDAGYLCTIQCQVIELSFKTKRNGEGNKKKKKESEANNQSETDRARTKRQLEATKFLSPSLSLEKEKEKSERKSN